MNERNEIDSTQGRNVGSDSSSSRSRNEMSDLKAAIMNRFRLTNREADVAIRLMEGDSYREAAAILGITVNTVNAHVTEILRKAGVRSSRRLASVLLREVSMRGSSDA